MAELTKNDIKNLERLSRIQIDKEQEEILCSNMTKILTYIGKLEEINTDNVQALSHPIESMSAPLREDRQGFMIETKEFLKNSPEHLGSMIKVPHIITDEAQDA